MIDYTFLKGELNKFNNINQELKNIFTDYYMDNTDLIFGTSKLHKGKHFVSCDYRFPFEFNDDIYLQFQSQSVFEAVSKNKKYIKSLRINNNIVLYGDEFAADIGSYINKSFVTAKTNLNLELLDKSPDVTMDLTSDAVEKLVKNAYINISEGKYRTRITKEIIPGLKKSHNISLAFIGHSTDKSLFHLLVKADRGVLTSCHIYTCLYM